MTSKIDITLIKNQIREQAEERKHAPQKISLDDLPRRSLLIYQEQKASIKHRVANLLRQSYGKLRHLIYSNKLSGYPARFLNKLLLLPRYIDNIEYQNELMARKLAFLHGKAKRLEEEQKYLYDLILDQQRRIDDSNRKLLDTSNAKSATVSQNVSFKEFYLAFENAHRGSQESIRQKLLVYVQQIKSIEEQASSLSVLDIGSGRGEWLEIIREHGWQGVGVDLDSDMVKICRQKGLEVVKEDAIDYLKSLPDYSLAVVTAFHVVEHIPETDLVPLLQVIYRKVKLGGIVILETPNPENLIVGACNFYTDLTHIKPIPPISLQFMLSFAGFKKTETLRLHPMKDKFRTQDPELKEVLERLYGSQDYALVGYKEN
ncbi:MAG: class I SAM-dependent methyltransferase [Oligoflexus sp.]